MRDKEMLAEIEDFLDGVNQPTYRGMRINSQRIATWSSEHGWSGDSRPDAEWIHNEPSSSRMRLCRNRGPPLQARER
jgi:hypothetical protein